VAHSARWLARWSADVELCKGIILPLVRQYGKYDVTDVICPRHLFALKGEHEDMRKRGRRTKDQEQPETETTTTEGEGTMGDEFDWDAGTNPEGDGGNVGTVEGTDTVVEAKPEKEKVDVGQHLREQFPPKTIVRLTKTDWKGNYAEVQEITDKRNTPYVTVKLLAYPDGKRRDESKQTVTSVRSTSVETAELPEVPEVPETEPASAEA